jgi:hypothetical protein
VRESLYSRTRALRALNHTAISTNTSTNGTAVDLDQSGQDFRVALLVAAMGAWTDGSYAFVPQESPDGTTGWVNVPVDRLQGSAALGAANAVGEVGVIPDPQNFRFLRVQVVSTGVTAGAAAQAVWLLGSPSSLPVRRP